MNNNYLNISFAQNINTEQHISGRKDKIRFSIAFILIYLIIAMHYFTLPTIHIYSEADIYIELVLFILLLIASCLTFLVYQYPFPKHLLIVLMIPSIALFYVFYGIIISKNNTFRAFYEYQTYLFFLSALFPIIFINRIQEARFILKGLLLSTIIYALFVFIQFPLLPYNITFIPGKFTESFMGENLNRFFPAAQVAIHLIFFYFYREVLRRPNIHNIVLFTLFTATEIMSLSRHLWASMFVGVIAITLIERKEILKKLPIMMLFILLGTFSIAIYFSNTSFGQSVLKRMSMISISAAKTDSSLMWRATEYKYAKKAISSQPVLGHGLGYAYHNINQFPNSEYYIHNAYLYYWMKMGLAGIIAFLTYLFYLLRLSFHVYRTYINDNIISGFAIAIFAFILGYIPSLVFSPAFSTGYILVQLVSVLLGILIKLKMLDNESKSLKPHD